MGSEIERKFLVDPAWHPPGEGTQFTQGYLSTVPERVVRVRLEGETAKLTIKGKTKGVTRDEFEYEIPAADALALLAMCEQPVIEKHRYRIEFDGKTWEVDIFHGENQGLVVAEIELASETEPFAVPPWAVEEVSHDARYYNANLQKHPFRSWAK